LNEKLRAVLITIGWTLITSTIILNALYQRIEEPMTLTEIALVFLVSVLTGMLLVDAEVVILSYVALLLLSIFTVYTSLTFPASLGVIQYASLRAILMEGAIGIVIRVVLVYILIPCLMGVIIGGILGERLRV